MSLFSTGPIFMSYSRKDREVMWRIVRFLRERGIKVWLDNEKLIPGTPIWEEEIEKAIKATSAVVAIMSPDSKISEWVRREISLADQHHTQIFPVLVRGDEDSSITLRLITRQYVDMRENEATGLNSLYEALASYLDDSKTQAPEDLPFEKTTTDRSVGDTSPTLYKVKEPARGEIIWISLAWALAGAIGGFMYSDYGAVIGGAVSGTIAGLITAITLRTGIISPVQKDMLWMILAWAISGAIGWSIGDALTEAIGMGIGYALFAAIAISITIRLRHLHLNWKSIAWVILSWAISGMIGWSIGRYIQENDLLDWATGWALGYALSWAIAGFVTVWQMRGMKSL